MAKSKLPRELLWRAALAEGRPVVDVVALWLPAPPSVNNLFRNISRGRGMSDSYLAWRQRAALAIRDQKPGLLPGRYEIVVVIGRGLKGDLWNYEKALSDALVDYPVIQDDSLCERGSIGWGDIEGAEVTVTKATPSF